MYTQTQLAVEKAASRQDKVAEDPRAAIRSFFEISRAVERMFTYARMRLDEDGSNDEAQTLLARIQALAVKAESTGAYLRPELLALPEETLQQMKTDPDFSEYDVFIDDILRDKPHTLPASEEKLLAEMSEIAQAPNDIFTMLSDVDRPLPTVTDENGQPAGLSATVYIRMLRSHDRDARQRAYEAEMKAYADFGQTFAATYRYSVKADAASARVRRFGSAIEASLFPDRIPVGVYDALLANVEEALPSLDRCLALRKKRLGVNDLHLYDLWTKSPAFAGEATLTQVE